MRDEARGDQGVFGGTQRGKKFVYDNRGGGRTLGLVPDLRRMRDVRLEEAKG